MNVLLLLVGVAIGAEESQVKVSPELDLWVAQQKISPFSVNAEGLEGGQDSHVLGRQIVGLAIEGGPVEARTAVSITEYQLLGSGWDIEGSIDERLRTESALTRVTFRELSVSSTLPVAQIQTGLMTSHWGLGMLANDGAHDPYFGLPEFGDRVIRGRITTQPIPDGSWYLTGAFDRVIQDEQVVDPRRQWAQQGVLSLVWRQDQNAAGLYGVARRQDELDVRRSTSVGVIDGFVDLTHEDDSGLGARFAMEVAAISGKTNRSTSYGSPERLRIRSLGATGVSMLSWQWLGLGSAFGYASGDGDPSDDEMNDFTFDRNHGVGMILFDEVSGSIEAATYLNLIDPEHVGSPPDGVEASVTEGAFRRATYIQPRLELDPLPWVHVRGGLLLAWSTAPVRQPFYTVRNGGVPLNHLQEPTEGYRLGTEMDWAIHVSPLRDKLRSSIGASPSVGVQWGRAWLAPNLGGESVDRMIVMLRVH